MEQHLTSLLFILILLGLSAFFSGSETALFSISNIQKDRLRREKSPSGQRILSLLEHPHRLIIALLMGNELVNVSISAAAAGLFSAFLPGNRWAPIVIVTLLLLIVGEISPKSVAITRPIIISRVISLPLKFFTTLIFPFRFLVEKLVEGITRLFHVRNGEPQPISQAEFRQLTRVGVAQGELAAEEADMILRVFDLGDTTAASIMTPRTEIVALPASTTLEQAIRSQRIHRLSRVPIYTDTIDNILGILHANDILRYQNMEKQPTVGSICRPALYVPGVMKADDLFQQFRNHRSHLAIVVDEFGGTAGLVTLDDVIGELFGELTAERADDDFTHRVCENGDLIVAGSLQLDEFCDLTGKNLAGETAETVGGMVFSHFGHLPSKGDIIVIGGLRFTVLTVQENRVWRLRVSRGGNP